MGFAFTNQLPQYGKYNIGNYTYGEPAILEYDGDTKLKIGRFCSFAQHIIIVLGGVHFYKGIIAQYSFEYPLFRRPYKDSYSNGDLTIGNDVWIATGAIILSGLEIGDGATIAAGSVVTRSVSPYHVVAGNPARKISQRFDDETIEKILQIQWWNWDIEKVKANYGILRSSNIDKLVEISQV